MKFGDLSAMKEEDRLEEIASLLALGFLRHRQNHLDESRETSVYGVELEQKT